MQRQHEQALGTREAAAELHPPAGVPPAAAEKRDRGAQVSCAHAMATSGNVHVRCRFEPQPGLTSKAVLPRFGMRLQLPKALDRLEWFGGAARV